jgi:hypothetical protein
MLSPGAGAGSRAAAIQTVKSLIPGLLATSSAFEAGSKEQQAILRAVSALNPLFGRAEGPNMVPAGLAVLGQQARQGPPGAAPPPAMAGGAGGAGPGAPPPMPPAAMGPGAEAA